MDAGTWEPIAMREVGQNGFISIFFKVDIQIVVRESGFLLEGDNFPALDFALMLECASRELRSSGRSEVPATASPRSISLTLHDDSVELSTNFSEGVVMFSLEEFDNFVSDFLRATLSLMYEAHEELRENRYLLSLSRELGIDRTL
ncbi:hypothetical protein F0L68_34420 [Solihabitans fulvus]|uniref:Uncharacterized protein n=1 Tax=Solihabitans fulvus TaxID=1892852 RepID=A0A5B2WM58_9PSEU|nr:hypothetical protein [Solihabitans fulvus]KAA2252861.1 hypothetical protein F0L68_34420 [Solihabitans fulvus]